MSEETIVPFADAAAKRANEALIERIKGVAANDSGNPNIAAIENILRAMEGMQVQVQMLTDIVIAQEKRIEALEKPKIIKVRS